MRVSDLDGWLLTYWVARSLGYRFEKIRVGNQVTEFQLTHSAPGMPYCGPVLLYAQGVKIDGVVHPMWGVSMPDFAGNIIVAWPIIEGDKISIEQDEHFVVACGGAADEVYACMHGTAHGQYADNPLTAAMRCKVASVFGNEVPSEITI